MICLDDQWVIGNLLTSNNRTPSLHQACAPHAGFLDLFAEHSDPENINRLALDIAWPTQLNRLPTTLTDEGWRLTLAF